MGLGDGSQALAQGGPAAGTGTALANIRERLQHAHGPTACLQMDAGEVRGVRVRLRLPVTP